MKNKKILIICTFLLGIIMLGVGTVAYFTWTVNGRITGQTGTLVFNVNGISSETNETFSYSLNRSAEEPYVLPDDSGYFDLEISADGSSTNVYVTIDIIRENLPDNLKFYSDEAHKVELSRRYIFIGKSNNMNKTLRIYWFWDGSVDDANDTLFMGAALSAYIDASATPMDYGMMEEKLNTISAEYKSAIREITFTNNFNGMPEECTAENLCFDISYTQGQKYPVYAYLVETDETGTVKDAEGNDTTGNLYDMYVVCSQTVFAPQHSTNLFSSLSNLKNINFNDWFNTSLATNMTYMFNNCTALTNLDLSSFNASGVTSMMLMFYNCTNLATIDFSNFDTSKVTSIYQMFRGCTDLTSLDLSSFNTSNVSGTMGMGGLFMDCTSLKTINLSSFDTSKVVGVESMFSGCSSLISLDLTSFDTRNVIDMNFMFDDCTALTSVDLSSFDTSSVTDMTHMFNGCSKLTSLDVSNFDTSSVTDMSYMFFNCSNLVIIYASDLWNVDAVTSSLFMFRNCSKLTGGNGTGFNSSYEDKTYAKIDEEGSPGYLTYKA